MPDPISSLRNILTNPAGGATGGPGFGTQDMPGSKPSPWVDYPLEALQGAIGVGADTPANRFGGMAMGAVPILGGMKSALMGGGEEALSGLRGAGSSMMGERPPLSLTNPEFTPRGGEAAYNLHNQAPPRSMPSPLDLKLGAGTNLTPGGNVPLPPRGAGGLGDVPSMKPYPMPSPSTPPSAGDNPHLMLPSASIPTSQTKRTSMGLDNPYGVVPAYDWPGMEDGSGSTQQYHLTGGPPKAAGGNAASTVGVATLKRMGLEVPYGPPPR